MSTTTYHLIGTRPPRHDGADKVTGRALYGADLKLAGTLHGAILRSPHAHARIVSIDTKAASQHPACRAVVTAEDFPETPDRIVDLGEGDTPLSYIRGNMLARRKTLYQGHAVAAVAATSPQAAAEIAALIQVVYEPLPCVLTAPAAMAKGAPLLHGDLRCTEFGQPTTEASNVADHFRQVMGDSEKGFAEADVIVEREFTTSTVHQGYIEPHTATALWNNDGRLLIWCSTQGSFVVRDTVACMLDLPVSRVRVTPMEIGGGFGGKVPVYVEPVAALLSKKSGQPVKITMTRREVLEGSGPTPGSFIRVKIGAKQDGTLVAAQAYLAYEAGAYPGAMVAPAATCVFAAYDIANQTIDGYDVVVNKPSTAPYRAPGATNAAFATETVLDEIAEKLKLDPLALRLKNASKEGTRRADGAKFRRIGCVEVLETMKAHPHYTAPLGEPSHAEAKRGRGVAVGFWMNAGLPSSCTLNVHADGSVGLIEGSTDIGGSRTSIAMMAAEVLGLQADDMRPSVVDTDTIGYTGVTGGSRTTFATGWAAYEAAQDVVKQMKERAAKLWKVDEVHFADGVFSAGEHRLSFKELAARVGEVGAPVVGRASINAKGPGGSFAGAIVDVEVDVETGKTSILRFTCVQDAGKAIHPSYVEGQMQGGSVQGIGWALNEEYFMSPEGRMMNASFLDYRMPTALDVPMIDTAIVEVPNPVHPYGVRGVGEANIVSPPAAIANAIHAATGCRMRHLPMNPPSVLAAIQQC
ncbi:MAG: xanthine dehydrogenase family protein molybdopterin-binding subunit [Bryobacteraceae bacterium]|nr:xanthine dehydrogenase family protein molybdopterin-binding subunit [Bryobacteraceae bacterium]